MDFFEAQERAKRRTRRLVVLFGLGVTGTVIAGYLAAILILSQLSGGPSRHRNRYRYEENIAVAPLQLWQPSVFAVVSIGTLAVVGGASLYKWFEFRNGGGAVAESVGGRRLDPHTTDFKERRLLNVVEEMAIASSVPMPVVYVLEDEPAINAFAAGLTTSDAVVAVTRGALDKLTRDELQGIVGHEFSHILNGDMRLNVKLSATLFGILVVGLIGRGVLNSLRYSRPRGKNSGGSVAVILAAGLALLLIGYVGYFFGRLIQSAVSRQREFLADASSVQFTRNPGGLTGALKKIGGYALGSSLQTSKSAAIGHFFFAQAFTSMLDGLWATHPPLAERIRAIDPRFDGQFPEPPEVVDVEHESFVSAGLAPARPAPPALPTAARAAQAGGRAFNAAAAVAAIGTLSAGQIADARVLLSSLPASLTRAARSPAEAAVLLYGLLLDEEPALRLRQRELVATHAGNEAAQALGRLEDDLRQLRPEHKLPLVQLALPALRELEAAALGRLAATLDELMRADEHVTPFEFALKKLVTRSLAISRAPAAAIVQIYSFNAVIDEIAQVLSAVAYASSSESAEAGQAFQVGAAQLKLLEGKLALQPRDVCEVTKLDAALDKLATASGPIKQRLITAAAYIVGADNVVMPAEAELLRAVAATLDVPMPALAA
jgi:Zn-dependent protease with chaperone function